MRIDFSCISVLRVASGPRVKLASCKRALNPSPPPLHSLPPPPTPPVVDSTDRSKAVVPVLVLLFAAALWFILRDDVLSFAWCYYVLVFFSLLSIAITSLREERANLSVFRMFVRFALVWFCLFPLPSRVWDGLRLVIVALPLDYPLTCL